MAILLWEHRTYRWLQNGNGKTKDLVRAVKSSVLAGLLWKRKCMALKTISSCHMEKPHLNALCRVWRPQLLTTTSWAPHTAQHVLAAKAQRTSNSHWVHPWTPGSAGSAAPQTPENDMSIRCMISLQMVQCKTLLSPHHHSNSSQMRRYWMLLPLLCTEYIMNNIKNNNSINPHITCFEMLQ